MDKKTRLQKLQRLKEIKREKIVQIRKQKEYREANRIEFFSTPPNPGPNPKQAKILEAWLNPKYKTLGLSGGERLGKTLILTLIGLSTLWGEFLWDGTDLSYLIPHTKPRKIRYIGQGWHDHIAAVVIPELEKWWPQNRPVEKHGNGIIKDTFWWDEKTKSTIEIMSNSQDPRVHRGWKGDLILYDEPCRREIYTSNARGLVDRKGRELFAATLLNEPWIDREIVKRRLDNGRPDPSVFWVQGTMYDNVGFGLTKKGVEEYRSKLKDSEQKSRIYGIPEYMEGLIFPEWDRKIHVRERFQVPLDWLIDIAIDCHPRENQAILFTAVDPMNQKWIVNEIFDHGDGTWIGENIVRCVNQNSYRVNRIICDPLAKGDKNNPNTTYDKIARVLMAHGLPLETATKDKSSGIKEITTHLMGPNKQPSLFVFDDCVRFIWEIEGWMWDEKTMKPIDKDDHQMENLYRTLMLGTKYREMEDEEYNETQRTGRSSVGGY